MACVGKAGKVVQLSGVLPLYGRPWRTLPYWAGTCSGTASTRRR